MPPQSHKGPQKGGLIFVQNFSGCLESRLGFEEGTHRRFLFFPFSIGYGILTQGYLNFGEGVRMRILAVDYGDARTGLAICDEKETLARPLKTVEGWDSRRVAEEIKRAAEKEGAERIVVGHPINMDGSIGFRAQICREFAQLVREVSGLPVVLWDERQTTVIANIYLSDSNIRGEKRKKIIDAVAAMVILEGYLRWRMNHPGEEEPNGTL